MSADFSISTEISARDGASAVLRRVGREARAVGGGFRQWIGGEGSRASGMLGKGLGVAGGALKGLGSIAKTSLFGSAGLLIGLKLGAEAVHGLVQEFIDAGDDIAAMSTKLGIGTQALQELRYAADLSDVSQDSLSAGISKLNQNLGKAKNGAGALYKALAKTSDGKVVLKDLLAAEGTDEAMAIVIEAASRIDDVGKRASFLKDAVGGASKEWMSFAENGASGLADLRREARATGLMTDDMIDTAGGLDDESLRLKATWRGLKMEIANQLAPSLLDLSTRFREWISENRTLISLRTVETLQQIGSGLQTVGGWLVEAYNTTSAWLADGGWDSIKTTLSEVWETVKSIGESIKAGVEFIGGWKNALILLGGSVVLSSLARLAGAIAAVRAASAGAAAAAAGAGAAGAGAGGAAAGGLMGIVSRFVAPVGLAYAGAKGFEAWTEAAAPQDQVVGAREDGAALYDRTSRGAVNDIAGALSGFVGTVGRGGRAETTADLARNYANAGSDSGNARAYGALVDRGASYSDITDLTAAMRRRDTTPFFDIASRMSAEKQINEIVVRFDGLPANATPTVTQTSGPAKVTAPVGTRGVAR